MKDKSPTENFSTRADIVGRTICVNGTVQGVGFRPMVWRLANEMGLRGRVLNCADTVLIHVFADAATIDGFVQAIYKHCPALAHIDSLTVSACRQSPDDCFFIDESAAAGSRLNVVADAATCAACLLDITDETGRRYRYPFTNCTHCGPRFSIIRSIPYDRANTSMSEFILCTQCRAEYEDPLDRRFHAQPNACPACGPQIWLERLGKQSGRCQSSDAIAEAAKLIGQGKILAIKGIGGFHLAAAAGNEAAVSRLRRLKNRYAKPLALMAASVDMVRLYCQVSKQECALLQSKEAPIVLLPITGKQLAQSVAPGQSNIGFMLAYSPLHHLLMQHMDEPIVLTSGNLSQEPQCIDNDDARLRLSSIADYALLNNRAIVNRTDDSVVRLVSGTPTVLRRARGYAPHAVPLPGGFVGVAPTTALGAQLKNTFCLIKHDKALVSQHIGDLHDALAYEDYCKNLRLYEQLFDHKPAILVSDMHPEYLSTKLAETLAYQRGLPLLKVQHHHAHIAACLAENDWRVADGAVIGVALDGLGYGLNGELWGGEVLLADYRGFRRVVALQSVPLIGGAAAIKEPWRNTYAHVVNSIGYQKFRREYGKLDLARFLEDKPLPTFDAMLSAGINCPPASSCGRLFDAVAAAAGICRQQISYEGQAASEFESCIDARRLDADETMEAYRFQLIDDTAKHGSPVRLDAGPMWHALLADLRDNIPVGEVSARFHQGLSVGIVAMVKKAKSIGQATLTNTVALSGGVFQNKTLLQLVTTALEQERFQVLRHSKFPANDGGISYGQAMIAAASSANLPAGDATNF